MRKHIFYSFFLILFLTACSHQENKLPQPLTEKKTILSFGDSLTEGLGVEKTESYPAQLQQKLIDTGFSEYRVVPAGISGETTSGAAMRLDWAMKLNPKLVIVSIGGNDALRGIPTDEVQKNLEHILQFFIQQQVQILFVGIEAPKNQGREYSINFNALYPSLAQKYELPFMPLFWESIEHDPVFIQSDGIHPTKEGYTRIVEDMWGYLVPLL